MTRKEFLKLCTVLSISPLLGNNQELNKLNKMPALFLSHGSPMNLIQEHMYAHSLKQITKTITKPKAILVISAHWYDNNTYVSMNERQNTIYDFYGFPDELYEIKYEPKGSPQTALKVKELLKNDSFLVERGLDHGAWSVLYHMYPNQDIPTFQISINKNLSYQEYFEIGNMLRVLRNQGVLVIGSGGSTHNLRTIKYPPHNFKIDDWAISFDKFVKDSFVNKKFDDLIDAKSHKYFQISHPFDDHFIPILYIAGMVDKDDKIENFYEKIVLGNLSMRCIKIG